MRNDFCTGYLEHSAKGKVWTNHKYIAKVKTAAGRTIYFYTMAEYQAFLKGKTVKSGASTQTTEKKQSQNAAKANVAANKKASESSLELAKKKIAETRNKLNENKKKNSSASAEVKAAKSTEDSKKKKSGSSSKSKKSGSKKSSSGSKKSSSSKSKEQKEKEKQEKAAKKAEEKAAKEAQKKADQEKKAQEKAEKASSKSEKQTQTKQTENKETSTANTEQSKQQDTTKEITTKTTPSLSSYKYQYDLKDDDINTYSGSDTDRVSTNRVQEIIDDMVDKYPNNSSGYLLSSFSDNITYQFKWVKEGGTIKLLDPDTGIEVAADTSLTNAKSVSLFRTDNRTKKS